MRTKPRTRLSQQAAQRFGSGTRQRRRSRGGGGLVGAFQAAHNRANQANEQRYGQIMGGYDDLHSRSMDRVNSLGDQQSADIRESYGDASSRDYQQLVNRGFGNSSLPSTMRMGRVREQNRDMRRLNDQLQRQRLATDVGITQGKLGVMERRNDVGPNPNQLIQLAQMMGQGGMGGMGGYGGGGGSYMLPPQINSVSPMQAMMPHMMMHQNNMGVNMGQFNALRQQSMNRAKRRKTGFGTKMQGWGA